MGRGAYINGRYVANATASKGAGRGRGRDPTGRTVGWAGDDEPRQFQRKPGDEDVESERKFDVDILQPGETRRGYLFNMKNTRHYDEGGRSLSGSLSYFYQRDGRTFRCTFLYRPYFFVQVKKSSSGSESMRDISQQRFEAEGVIATLVEKEDLALEDHIVGKHRSLIRLSFQSNEGLNKARMNSFQEMKGRRSADPLTFDSPQKNTGSAIDDIEELYEHDVAYVNRVCIDNKINVGKWYDVTRNQLATSIEDLYDTQCKLTESDMQKKPGLRIFAWDIECTKEPLKFPDSTRDRITMISIMVDGSGFLIVNRAEVSADIEPSEYTPKPEYEGVFQTYNEEDEVALLKRFFSSMRETCPHVMVSFNGDFFDYPFVQNRAKAYNLDWYEEAGIQKVPNEEYFAGKWIVHSDCFAWVQRDSYSPCGARGLKAVTRYKLKYDPVELDPEDMTPFAKERPQESAAYSVSDAVATYYSYMKYIHDFIFASCSIIPYGPDDVLRKGSGTLCESLLMNQAAHANVLFPNKHVDPPLEFHEATNRLVEQSTYEGARVECMRVGVYRADIKETFKIEPSAVQTLSDHLKGTVDFFLTQEEKVKLEDVENYEEVLAEVEAQSRALCDPDKVAAQVGRLTHEHSPLKTQVEEEQEYQLQSVEYEVIEGKGGIKTGGKKVKKSSYRVVKDDFPLIYHLDVGAMYPNIILSNRLQPMAIVSKEFCNSCTYNDPSNNCQREMDWKWRGDLYMATRADVKAIINEMESEKRRYNSKDKETGEVKRVKWSELHPKEQTEEITKAVRQFSQKAYKRSKSSVYEDKRDIVCQRENPFYVNTVLNFRDRRYMFKRRTKEWNKKSEKAEESGDLVAKSEAKDMVLSNDSLQLAHKCILNSFYGYVMRKGARWHSMKMAGIVTYTGANLIREAREFCEQVGLPLESDTDGIWCLLPKSFPDTFKIKMKGGKEIKMPYPNCVLNYRVHRKYTNHQYQDWDNETKSWKTSSQNSILFEIDGPYKAMISPASTEEDKMLKKRYAVYNFDGSLAELKGFEVKRRGESRLIQVFQTEVFPEFSKGNSKEEVWQIVGAMANRWLDVIESKGSTMTNDEVIHFFSENKTMSKSVEAVGSYKCVQATTVRRLSEFSGVPSMSQAEGISAHMSIANKPVGASCTERAIPVKIFFAEEDVKKVWLRQWLQDSSLTDFDMRSIIDWEYYKERLCAVFQKSISIPAAYQKIANPCPRVKVPEWLRKRVAEQNDRFKQRSSNSWLQAKCEEDRGMEGPKRKTDDMEDLAGALEPKSFGQGPKKWSEVQRMRWAGQNASKGSWQASSFDANAGWASVPTEVLRGTWHVLAIEPSCAARTSLDVKVGDPVLAEIPVDHMDDLGTHHPEEATESSKGTVMSFAGGSVRSMMDSGEEEVVKRSAVRPIQDGGLFTMWFASGPGMAVYRCEVAAKRRVISASESESNPEETSREVRPSDLIKGLKVRGSAGDGVVTSSSKESGLCSVQWHSGGHEAVFCKDLSMQTGNATRVTRDAPRNLRHGCSVEMQMSESDFQQQHNEGRYGEDGWPRVSSVFEAEQPSMFDLMCRLGPVVRLNGSCVPEQRRNGLLRIDAEELQSCPEAYLQNSQATRNVYLHSSFDRAKPSRAFCGIYAPALSEAWVCFSGGAESKQQELEIYSSELFAKGPMGHDGDVVRIEVSFQREKRLDASVLWAEQRSQEIRKHDGGCICILSSQSSSVELRGSAPSCYLQQKSLRNVTASREIPLCQAPFKQSKFVLDWQRSLSKYFASVLSPGSAGWWKSRVNLCRAAGVPACSGPETIPAFAQNSLDVMYSRQLVKDSQIRWASPGGRPDLGETSLALVDAQEESVEALRWVLQGKDSAEGRGGGQINKPGVYRTICSEVNLRSKLCICALQHARYLSDMEGGESSRKMIRKVGNASSQSRNMDHSSEASVTNSESLVSMVQELCSTQAAKVREMENLWNAWAKQSSVTLEGRFEEVCSQVLEQCDDLRLVRQIQDSRDEWQTIENSSDGLYGWLASPSSLLYDAASLRRVQQYMDRVSKLLIDVIKRNGCGIIHASYSKVLIETKKSQIPEVTNFYQALLHSMNSTKASQPLRLDKDDAQAAIYYGMIWSNPSDWAGVPIEMDTGEVCWEAENLSGAWKVTDYLPPAVQGAVRHFAADSSSEPQKILARRFGLYSDGEKQVADLKIPQAMEVDDKEEQDAPCEEERDGDEEMPDAAEKPAEEEAEETSKMSGEKEIDQQTAKSSEEVQTWTKSSWFEEIRQQMMSYVSEIQARRLKELSQDLRDLPPGDESDDDIPGRDAEDPHAAAIRRQKRLRQQSEEKWSFPFIPGRRAAPGAINIECMRAIIQIFKSDDSLREEVEHLRDDMCEIVKVSSFQHGSDFESPAFPLILRDVSCQRCCEASHVDVTSHPTRGPGLWVCTRCDQTYDKDAMQARLVDLSHSIIQAWQSQEVICKKCRGLRLAQMQQFCECFGRYEASFKSSDFHQSMQVSGSSTEPHDLPWSRESSEFYEQGMQV